MQIKTREKKYGSKHSIIKKDIVNSSINLDTFTLDLMCRYILSSNNTIRRGQLINLRNLIYSANPNSYISDIEKEKKFNFIKKGIEARLIKGLIDPEMISREIAGSIEEPENININHFKELTMAEVSWLNNMISETLKFEYIYPLADKLIDICTKIKSSDYGSKTEVVKRFEQIINETQSTFRRLKNEEEQEAIFSLKDGIFEDSIIQVHNDLNNPRNFLRSGMQGLNGLLGGGFECGRFYVFFGLPGEGKSTMLLNLCYQLKKHNKFYQTKDPTKRPCIVLLTMENKVKESINRLFGIATASGSIKDVEPEKAIDMMRNEGELYLSDDNPIDIIIKFKPTNSVDTSYLYTLTEDLEDEGYEVICMVQDYIGRIRSIEHSADIRIEYGNVVDEMKVYANIKDIPVISASQLNRDASKHIDEARKSNKNDLVRLLGRSNVSESSLILNNCDGGYMIAPEITPDGRKYLGVQKVKSRVLSLIQTEYIYLPFVRHNDISLEEDINMGEPLYKTSLRNDEVKFGPKISPYHTNKIVELGQIVNNDGDAPLFNGEFISSEGAKIAKYSSIKNNYNIDFSNIDIYNIAQPVLSFNDYNKNVLEFMG